MFAELEQGQTLYKVGRLSSLVSVCQCNISFSLESILSPHISYFNIINCYNDGVILTLFCSHNSMSTPVILSLSLINYALTLECVYLCRGRHIHRQVKKIFLCMTGVSDCSIRVFELCKS